MAVKRCVTWQHSWGFPQLKAFSLSKVKVTNSLKYKNGVAFREKALSFYINETAMNTLHLLFLEHFLL